MFYNTRAGKCGCVCERELCSGSRHVCMYAYLELRSAINQYPPPHFNTHPRTHRATSEAQAPDRVSRSINYISAPAIKQGYYQAAAHRPGKAWPIKGCCDVGAGTRSCDSNAEWQVMLSKERKMGKGNTGNGGWIQRERTQGRARDNNKRISVNHLISCSKSCAAELPCIISLDFSVFNES